MTADAGISALRRGAAWLVADHPGSPALLEIATEMNRIDDGVHIAAPVLRRERDDVSQPLTPFFTISDGRNIVAQNKKCQIDCIPR